MEKACDYRTGMLNISSESTLEAVDFICLKVRKLLTENKLDDLIFEITLISREVLVNAVKYGGKMRKDRSFRFLMRIDAEQIIMAVIDQGNGFDWKRTFTKEIDLHSEGGRGLLIMNKYATSLRYNRHGNRALIKRNI